MGAQLDNLMNRWREGTLSTEEVRHLTNFLATKEGRAALRADWFLEAALPEALQTLPVSKMAQEKGGIAPAQASHWTWFHWRPLAVAAAVFLAAYAAWWQFPPGGKHGQIVARFDTLHDCRWVDSQLKVSKGDLIRRGQRVELSSGRAEIVFASGAVSTLFGPCIFEVESGNGGFLKVGQIKTRAATPHSRGFTVRTRTAQIVDVGTEFVTSASADGLSRVDVTAGEVFVHVDGLKKPQHLHRGDALSVEAGKARIMVRIESGDGTPAFSFPTIEPPSPDDAADISRGTATARIVQGRLAPRSGDLTKLFNGKGQPSSDSPEESVFFADNASGLILLDLGRVTNITKVNTFSWHRNRRSDNDHVRATQKFALYAFSGDTPPAMNQPLAEHDWELVGRVNTDEFFNVGEPRSRPEQQASSITAAGGAIGRYRYLLWDIRPSLSASGATEDNTFYGEFDVYAQP